MNERRIKGIIEIWGLALIAIIPWQFDLFVIDEKVNVFLRLFYFLLMFLIVVPIGPYFSGKIDKNLQWLFENKKVCMSFARIGLLVPLFVILFVALELIHGA